MIFSIGVKKSGNWVMVDAMETSEKGSMKRKSLKLYHILLIFILPINKPSLLKGQKGRKPLELPFHGHANQIKRRNRPKGSTKSGIAQFD